MHLYISHKSFNFPKPIYWCIVQENWGKTFPVFKSLFFWFHPHNGNFISFSFSYLPPFLSPCSDQGLARCRMQLLPALPDGCGYVDVPRSSHWAASRHVLRHLLEKFFEKMDVVLFSHFVTGSLGIGHLGPEAWGHPIRVLEQWLEKPQSYILLYSHYDQCPLEWVM